jgi:hypothetical protein
MKIISPKIHGAIDYAVVAFLWLSPSLFGLSSNASKLTYGLGVVHLTLTILTDFPLGVIKIVPMKFHGIIELVVSVVLVTLPLLVGFRGVDMAFYISFGAAVFVTWLLTDYKRA